MLEIGYEEDTGTLEDHGDRGSLMSAEDEVRLDVRDHVRALLVTGQPLLEMLLAEAFLTGCDPYDDTAVLDRVLGVVQGFLRLIHIDVLRETAGGNDNDVGLLRNGYLVEGIEEFATLSVREDRVTREASDDLFLRVENDVDDVVDA